MGRFLALVAQIDKWVVYLGIKEGINTFKALSISAREFIVKEAEKGKPRAPCGDRGFREDF
jgi:hypothetical protein